MPWSLLDYDGRVIGDGAVNSEPLLENSWQLRSGVVKCGVIINCADLVLCGSFIGNSWQKATGVVMCDRVINCEDIVIC